MKKQKIRFEEIVMASNMLDEEMSLINGGVPAICGKGTVCDAGSSDEQQLDAYC